MAVDKNDLFRWFDFDVYGEKDSIPNKEIAQKLESTYRAVFKIFGEIAGKDTSFEDALEYAQSVERKEEKGTLRDVLQQEDLFGSVGKWDPEKGDSDDVKNKKKEERTAIFKKAEENIKKLLENGEIDPEQAEVIKAYFQGFESYGTKSRDNVLTSATILTTVNVNTRIGCGQGKTDISKAWAMAKKVEGKRAVITTSTPELAAQSFQESLEGFYQADLKIVQISGTQVMYPTGERDEKKGKLIIETKDLSDLNPGEIEEIQAKISGANVVISDLTSLVIHRESGLYVADKEKDVLLQDEQDEALFNNLWNIEIKGDVYDESIHKLRIEARQAAAKAISQLGESLAGDKISQSVSINGTSPEFEVSGNKVIIVGTDVEVEIPSGIDELEMQEFLMDAMFASKVFNEPGIDYVIEEDIVKPISPATGSREDIPEGVLQAIAVKDNIPESKIQPEYEVKKVVSKLSILKEGFAEISGMSATYGQMGSKVTEEFLDALTSVGISPDLIPVLEIYKEKGRIPNFENIKELLSETSEMLEEDLLIVDGKEEDGEYVDVTIDGKKVSKFISPPHIAAILKDIEAHPDEAIIIATDDREKTIEITKALQDVYGKRQAPVYKKNKDGEYEFTGKYEDAIRGYSGVPQENGDPKLFSPPNPAKDEKLNITPPRIIIGDHSIGRGVTPFDEPKTYRDDPTNTETQKDIKGEHLIVAQMPSRSEALLEQFLGRVGRKEINGTVSFLLSKKDKILEEYIEKDKNGKLPKKLGDIIREIYPSKTQKALESTKAEVEVSRETAEEKIYVMEMAIATVLMPDDPVKAVKAVEEMFRDPEKLKSFLEKNPQVEEYIQIAEEYYDKQISLLYKQYKGGLDTSLDISAKVADGVIRTVKESMKEKEKIKPKNSSKQKEIAEATLEVRYSKMVEKINGLNKLKEANLEKPSKIEENQIR